MPDQIQCTDEVVEYTLIFPTGPLLAGIDPLITALDAAFRTLGDRVIIQEMEAIETATPGVFTWKAEFTDGREWTGIMDFRDDPENPKFQYLTADAWEKSESDAARTVTEAAINLFADSPFTSLTCLWVAT